MKYKDDIIIDKNILDEEWEMQPVKVLKWGLRLTDAQEARDRVKDRAELVYARIGALIRADPEDYGLKDKPAESAIQSVIIRNKEYRNMRKEVIAAEKEVKALEIVMRSLEHRKRALEKITDLFFSGYWSEPRAKRGSQVESHRESRGKHQHEDALREFDNKLKRR